MAAFNHIHICCVDLARMTDFWTRGVGAELIGYCKFAANDGAKLTLGKTPIFLKQIAEGSPLPNSTSTGLNHIALDVDDVQKTIDFFTAEFGCTLLKKVSDDCAFVTGPEGVGLELLGPNF